MKTKTFFFRDGRLSRKLYFAQAIFFTLTFFASCSKDTLMRSDKAAHNQITQPGQRTDVVNNPINGKNVMIEAFYTNVPQGGTWWNTIQSKISSWAGSNITCIWLPPCSKGASGAVSNGYDPFDYFDFGDYNQMGTTKTRYGDRADLVSLIQTAHNSKMAVYADIVMNHNAGGSSEYNSNYSANTATSFVPASGIFPRHYNDFHKSTYEAADGGVFNGGTLNGWADLCHKNPEVANGLWAASNSVAKYYMNTLGFDGWRFDWVDGYSAAYVKAFVTAAPGFAVTEFWGHHYGTMVSEIQSCIDTSGQSSFDIPCTHAMINAFNNGNLTVLQNYQMLCKSNPSKAVTFVANHDQDSVTSSHKMQAYAFIMAHEGEPCLFYPDYESSNKSALNTLIWINENLAFGTTSVLYADNDEYIAQMSGSPGLAIYINTTNVTQSRTVTTKWANASIHDNANNWNTDLKTDANGSVTLSCPANSYTIWSTSGAASPNPNITITLTASVTVNNGTSVFFTGDASVLTSWNTGVQGIWTSGNIWKTTITVPAGTTSISCKLRQGPTGGVGGDYETGNNTVITNPVNGGTYPISFSAWQ